MKIFLVYPPYGEIYGSFRKSLKYGFLNPPLGLGYLAASLEEKGHQIRIVDGEAELLTNQDIAGMIKRESPDLVGITATTPDFHKAVELAGLVRQDAEARTVIGGVHVTIFRKEILQNYDCFDFGIIGEGERPIVELAKKLENKTTLKDVKSLIYREDGRVVENELADYQENIDTLPFPSRHLIKNELYLRSIPKKGYVKTTAFMSSRGCPYRCIYCAIDKIPGSRKIRFRSPENVVEELDLIVSKFKINHVSFNDDVLTLNKERIYSICKEIHKRKLKFTWEGLGRADNVDEELLSCMKEAGFVRISYGIESGNEDILKTVQKGETLEEIKKAYEITQRVGIVARGSVILGLPYETKKTVRQTFEFINNLKGIDQAIINIASPYPGTKLREMVQNGEGGSRFLSQDDVDLRRFDNAVFEVNDLSKKDLIRLQKIGLLSFYLRPKIILRNICIANPKSFVIDSMLFLRSIFKI